MLVSRTLDELTIDDDADLTNVDAYRLLKAIVRGSRHRFLVPEPGAAKALSWDRALFLNLTFWNDQDGADVLCDDHIPADVVAHVGWHHVVARQIARAAGDGPVSPAAMFFGESIASAFDLYLVGRLLPLAPDSDFIATQVPIMAEAAEQAGLAAAAFATLIEEVVAQPERAFEDLRALLFSAANALLPCRGPAQAMVVLEGLAGHRFEPLLHHFQLSNWILYARAYAAPAAASTRSAEAVNQLDATLRQAPDALAWLVDSWLLVP